MKNIQNTTFDDLQVGFSTLMICRSCIFLPCFHTQTPQYHLLTFFSKHMFRTILSLHICLKLTWFYIHNDLCDRSNHTNNIKCWRLNIQDKKINTKKLITYNDLHCEILYIRDTAASIITEMRQHKTSWRLLSFYIPAHMYSWSWLYLSLQWHDEILLSIYSVCSCTS